MKRFLLLAPVLCLVVLLAACRTQPAASGDAMVTKEALQHHNYILQSVDGNPVSFAQRQPSIQFNEGFQVSGAICNRYHGQAELANNVLTVRQMASTKMLCFDPALNQLEADFATLLMNGAQIRLSDTTLTLSGNGRTLVFTLRDYVQ